MSKKNMYVLEGMQPKTLILGLYVVGHSSWQPEDYYEEFESLIRTAGIAIDVKHFTKLRIMDRVNVLTKGKMNDLLEICEREKPEHIICSLLISPIQHRNLEDLTGCKVFDRGQLILEIFKRSATTAEGQLQVKMAEIKMAKTRLSGCGVDLAQQAGGIGGTRGAGETQKEKDSRFYETLIHQAKKRMGVLKKTREEQRKRRLNSGKPMICIVGYTNAGKSSLLNLMTKSEVLVEDKLFATLDTTTRSLFLDYKKEVLISDTVGFISDLPHHLVEAFRSTLDELRYADLLLHVVDASSYSYKEHIKVVDQTLAELNIDKPIITVFNKIDKLDADDLERLSFETFHHMPAACTHTRSKDGVADLRRQLLESTTLWGKQPNEEIIEAS